MLLTSILVTVAILVAIKKKDWNKVQKTILPLFTFYICVVIGITILYRLPSDNVHYITDLFWSYKKAKNNGNLFWEIGLNYLMLLPVGIMAPAYIKRRWTVLSGCLFSVTIEVAQFFLRRGLFEFDDIIGNTLGVLIGVGIYHLIEMMHSKRLKDIDI